MNFETKAMTTRRSFLYSCLALGLVCTATGTEAAADARAFVERLASQAIETARAPMPDQERINRFRQLFVAHFDLPEIGKFILGRHWRSATPQQRDEFIRLFEELSVLQWAGRFRDYNGETLDVTGLGQQDDSTVFVESVIRRRTAQPISITWRLSKSASDFRIIDITVEGVSMAVTHRSEYTSAIAGAGGLDGLFAAMRKKIDSLRVQHGVRAG